MVLLSALRDSLKVSERADFRVGYFNLRGWKNIDHLIEPWCGSEGACCRLLVGMQPLPREQLRSLMGLAQQGSLDQQAILRLKKQVAEEFHEQLLIGAPTNDDEAGLRRLSTQLKSKKVVVKLFLRQALHAKLYLLHRTDPNNPCVGFVGSSNLTFAGLSTQGELNVDVLDQDACIKLTQWFNDRWNDKWCLDISADPNIALSMPGVVWDIILSNLSTGRIGSLFSKGTVPSLNVPTISFPKRPGDTTVSPITE
jgi:hypothetical protein